MAFFGALKSLTRPSANMTRTLWSDDSEDIETLFAGCGGVGRDSAFAVVRAVDWSYCLLFGDTPPVTEVFSFIPSLFPLNKLRHQFMFRYFRFLPPDGISFAISPLSPYTLSTPDGYFVSTVGP